MVPKISGVNYERRVYDAFHGERDCFWRWFCIVTAHPFWPGRRIIFHAGIRCADGGYIGSSDCKDI